MAYSAPVRWGFAFSKYLDLEVGGASVVWKISHSLHILGLYVGARQEAAQSVYYTKLQVCGILSNVNYCMQL